MLEIYFFVFLGGGVGAVSRFFVDSYVKNQFDSGLPWGTFAVNIIGCFLIGFVLSVTQKSSLDRRLLALISTGFLGGLTTFSTFSKETFELVHKGEFILAITNIVMQISSGLIAVYLGFWILNKIK